LPRLPIQIDALHPPTKGTAQIDHGVERDARFPVKVTESVRDNAGKLFDAGLPLRADAFLKEH